MKVLTEGHLYELSNFENKEAEGQKLQFIEKKQVDDKFVTVNDGTTNEEVIGVLVDRLKNMNSKFPSKETSCAITKLEEANMWLYERTRKRVAQNVEGKPLNHK